MALNRKLIRKLTKDFIVPHAKEIMRPHDVVIVEKDEDGRTTMRGRPISFPILYTEKKKGRK